MSGGGSGNNSGQDLTAGCLTGELPKAGNNRQAANPFPFLIRLTQPCLWAIVNIQMTRKASFVLQYLLTKYFLLAQTFCFVLQPYKCFPLCCTEREKGSIQPLGRQEEHIKKKGSCKILKPNLPLFWFQLCFSYFDLWKDSRVFRYSGPPQTWGSLRFVMKPVSSAGYRFKPTYELGMWRKSRTQ